MFALVTGVQTCALPIYQGEAVMAATETTPITKPRLPGSFEIAFRLLLANPLGLFGLCAVVLIVLTVILAPWLAPYDPIRIMVGPRLAPPSLDHFLGTDQLGRDVFSRVLVGGRIALLVALASIGAALTLGLALGLAAGFGPRWLDNAIMLLFDTVRSFPVVIFGLATVTVVGPSLATIIFIVLVPSIPPFGRVARTQTMAKIGRATVRERVGPYG